MYLNALVNIFFCILFGERVLSSKIIFNGMHASDSHVVSALPFALRLAADGHDVHFFETHIKEEGFKFPPQISSTYIKTRKDPIFANVIYTMWTNYYGTIDYANVFLSNDRALQEILSEHNYEVSPVLNSTWDLVICDELFSFVGYALCLNNAKQGKAMITLSSTVSSQFMIYYQALGSFHLFSHVTGGISFSQLGSLGPINNLDSNTPPIAVSPRLITVFDGILDILYIPFRVHWSGTNGIEQLGIQNFHLSQIAAESYFYIHDDINLFTYPSPVGNEILQVGFYCPKFGNLTGEYKVFVENPASQGTILVAFGTNVLWDAAPSYVLQSFITALNNLENYRVIWSYNGNMTKLGGIKQHILVTRWAPQKEILAHHKTVLFVSHGGMKSLKDTICAGVPMVFFPVFAEQGHNAHLGEMAGFGTTVKKTEVTPEKLETAARKVLEDASYKLSILKYRSVYLDRPIPPMDLVSWAVKRSIRTGSRQPTFKRKAMFLTLTQYYYLDLVIVLFVIIHVVM